MVRKLNKYAVDYAFEGGGKLIVEATTRDEAFDKAREVLKSVIESGVRPETAKAYTSRIEKIPDDSTIQHTRSICVSWQEREA